MVDMLVRERTDSGVVLTREIKVSARILDDKTREVEFIGATETPVDFGDGIPEVLRISGSEFEKSVPFLNAHQRRNVLDVLGRAEPRRDGRKLVFRVFFSQATEAARASYELVKDGSIDAVSVGYGIKEFRRLRANETDGDGEARVQGPAVIVTKWPVRELSLVPIGADPNARRRAYEGTPQEDHMKLRPNPGETREQFTARGMADALVLREFPDEAKRRAFVDAAWDEANPKSATPAPAAPAPAQAPAASSPAPTPAPAQPAASTRHLDEDLAVELEARKKLILSRCPKELHEFLDGLLLAEPMIEPKDAWKRLLEERARRLPGGGTPEPKRPGVSPQAPAPAATNQPTVEERNDLGRLIREVRS